MRRLVAALAAAVVAAATGGCSTGEDIGLPATTTVPATTTTAAAGPEPAFVPAPCDGSLAGDPRIECGTVARPDGIVLAVAVLRSADPDPLPDPIVYFSGGPGFPGRTIIPAFRDRDLGGRRDVVVFDQRGTGASTPSLDCPELVEPFHRALESAADALSEGDVIAGAALACRDRLVAEGVDLDAFDTPTTAADADAVRRALGIEEWNLFGVSCGTTVALEVARTYPETVRSVVLDSVYPPDVGIGAEVRVAAAQRALETLVAGCEAHPGCAGAYPTLRADVDALVAEWDAEPFATTVDGRSYLLTGSDLVAGLWNAMYDSALIPVLPSLVAPLRAREGVADAVVAQLARDGIAKLTGAAEGVAVGVDCADRQRLGGMTEVEAVSLDPRFESLLALGSTRRCELWDVESVDAAFNDPVVSDLPALVLGNEYDPVTPPADSERAARGFANGTFVLLPGLGHGAVLAHACPLGLFRAFLDNPAAPLDLSCVAAMGPPAWVTP